MLKKSKQNPDTNEDVPLRNGDERIAQIVLSVAGRDKNRYFVICGVIDKDFVLIADGKLRSADTPKKKIMRHLRFLGAADAETAEKIYAGKITNAALRKAIEQYAVPSDEDNA